VVSAVAADSAVVVAGPTGDAAFLLW